MFIEIFMSRPGPNAPFEWIEQNILRLAPNHNDRSKLLVGFNLYGNIYSSSKSSTIVGSSFLNILEKFPNYFLNWHDEYKEHYFEFVEDGTKHTLFYPSLKSIDERIGLVEELGASISLWEIGQGLDYLVKTFFFFFFYKNQIYYIEYSSCTLV